MNERLKELMIQADYPAPELALRAHRLAELIVRECADIATLNQFQWDSAGGYVLEHFGVRDES